MKDRKNLLPVISAILLILGNLTFYFGCVQKINVPIFVLALVIYAAAFATIITYTLKKPVISAVIGVALSLFIAGTWALLHYVSYWWGWAIELLYSASSAAIFLICYFNEKKRCGKYVVWIPVVASVLMVALAMIPVYNAFAADIARLTNYRVAAPTGLSTYVKKAQPLVENADLYIATDGNDENDGSFNSPLATIERARDIVREMDKTGKERIVVALKAGEYCVTSIHFSAEDSGTADCPVTYCAYGDGEVILNGGITLSHDDLKSVTDPETLNRLTSDAGRNVLAVDLFALGITKEQYGKITAFGNNNQANKYDGDWTGVLACELFVDDCRQTVARYPNGDDYLKTGKVVKEGQGGESSKAIYKEGYAERRNPEPDVYKMSKKLSDRIKSWKTTEDVWMFGYWCYDWADASTPLGVVDFENRTMSPMFVSYYGARKGAPYYFFNVFEEMDSPGEWYLDRNNGVLYFYPPEGFDENSTVELSLSTENVIVSEASYMTFDGLTVKGTRVDAVNVTGDNNVIRNCTIKNVAGHGLIMTGYNNLVTDNEVTRTGRGGIFLYGGDRETLTAGNNRAENNLIHDWSEIYETYQPGVGLYGVGNVCAHNEMYNSPHQAITYSGNDHIVEYNLLHDVNLKTDDASAIYSGRHWDWYGNVIRYNLIYNLGADGHSPQGIYLDDGLSGQTVYGNILINVPSTALMLCCGRDLEVHDNIVINSFQAVHYDGRMLDGLPGHEDSNFYPHYKENGDCWRDLFASPWQTEIWQEAYPQYKRFSDDFSNPDDPNFVLNPAYSTVTHNLFVTVSGSIGNVTEDAYKYSTIENNAIFTLSAMRKLFVDPKHGDYTVRDDAPMDFDIDVPAMCEFGRQSAKDRPFV